MKDKYKNFIELRKYERENMDFIINTRNGKSDAVVIAPHGGGIEPATTELADSIAGENHSFYSFNGIKPKDNFEFLHITSANYDELQCLKMVAEIKQVIAIHGCDEDDANDKNKMHVYLGGRNHKLVSKIKNNLRSSGFEVGITPEHLKGEDENNICNRGKTGAGVQIEIQSGLRAKMFNGNFKRRDGRTEPTEIFNNFVLAIRNALLETN